MNVKKGNVTSDQKMRLELELTGLDMAAIIELQKDGNLLIEIDGKSAITQEINAIGEDKLLVLTETVVGDEQFKDFNNGKFLDLDVRTDLNYGAGNTASKMLSTKFKKGAKQSSLGQEIAFSERTETDLPGNPTAQMTQPQKQLDNLRKKTESQINNRQEQRTSKVIEDEYYSSDSVKRVEKPTSKVSLDERSKEVPNKIDKSVKSVKTKID